MIPLILLNVKSMKNIVLNTLIFWGIYAKREILSYGEINNMGAYNVRTLTYKNQTQVRFFKKPIEFDKKKVRANERKKKTEEERTQFDIDLSVRQSMHRTKDKIWNICLANDWEYFVTFTFNPKIVNSEDYDDCSAKMSKWLMNAKQICAPDLKYCLVPEYHSDKKKFHFHALMSNLGDIQLVDSGRRKDKGTKIIYNIANYRLGFSTAIPINKDSVSQGKIVGYMLKYITKDLATLTQGKKRYWYTRTNCEKPVIDTYLIESDKLEDFMEALENDKTYRKTVDMPFSDNELKIFNFDTN